MGLRFYGFAYCFWNVSGCPAASSVRAAPCQLPRRGSFCTGLWGTGFFGNGSVLWVQSKRRPWLSLWESWLGAAETERGLRRLNENVH